MSQVQLRRTDARLGSLQGLASTQLVRAASSWTYVCCTVSLHIIASGSYTCTDLMRELHAANAAEGGPLQEWAKEKGLSSDLPSICRNDETRK